MGYSLLYSSSLKVQNTGLQPTGVVYVMSFQKYRYQHWLKLGTAEVSVGSASSLRELQAFLSTTTSPGYATSLY